MGNWRMGWDSNPRYPCGHAGFQDRCLKPLGHPSGTLISLTFLSRQTRSQVGVATEIATERQTSKRRVPSTDVVRTYFSTSERGVDPSRGVLLHGRGDVRIKVEGYADRRMPEPFLRHLGMHASEQELGRVAVPEIMESHARHVFRAADKASELVCQAARLHWLAIGAGTKECITGLPNPEEQKFLSLLALQPAKLVDRKYGNRDRARLLALRSLGPQ